MDLWRQTQAFHCTLSWKTWENSSYEVSK